MDRIWDTQIFKKTGDKYTAINMATFSKNIFYVVQNYIVTIKYLGYTPIECIINHVYAHTHIFFLFHFWPNIFEITDILP